MILTMIRDTPFTVMMQNVSQIEALIITLCTGFRDGDTIRAYSADEVAQFLGISEEVVNATLKRTLLACQTLMNGVMEELGREQSGHQKTIDYKNSKK